MSKRGSDEFGVASRILAVASSAPAAQNDWTRLPRLESNPFIKKKAHDDVVDGDDDVMI